MTPATLPSRQIRWQAVGEPAVLLFACVFPTVMAWVYFVELAAPAEPALEIDTGSALRLAYALGKLAQFSLPVVFMYFAAPGSLRIGRPRFGGLAFGLAFGAAVAFAILLLYFGVLRELLNAMGLESQVRAKLHDFGADTPIRFLGLAAFIAVVHSFMEEYYWRWFVFQRLRAFCSYVPALIVSSLAFMAHHVIVLNVYLPGHFVSAVVPFSLAIAVGGAFWAWLFARTESLGAVWLSHLMVDVAIMAIGFDVLLGS